MMLLSIALCGDFEAAIGDAAIGGLLWREMDYGIVG
jgi:hypothetical protein